MMTALLLYAYCSGLYSSRGIARGCAERVDFMLIVAEKAGLAKLGHVALDIEAVPRVYTRGKREMLHARRFGTEFYDERLEKLPGRLVGLLSRFR